MASTQPVNIEIIAPSLHLGIPLKCCDTIAAAKKATWPMRFFVDEDCEVPVAGGLKAVPLLRLDELTHVNGTKLALKQSKKNPVDPVQELLEVLHKAQPNPRLIFRRNDSQVATDRWLDPPVDESTAGASGLGVARRPWIKLNDECTTVAWLPWAFGKKMALWPGKVAEETAKNGVSRELGFDFMDGAYEPVEKAADLLPFGAHFGAAAMLRNSVPKSYRSSFDTIAARLVAGGLRLHGANYPINLVAAARKNSGLAGEHAAATLLKELGPLIAEFAADATGKKCTARAAAARAEDEHDCGHDVFEEPEPLDLPATAAAQTGRMRYGDSRRHVGTSDWVPEVGEMVRFLGDYASKRLSAGDARVMSLEKDPKTGATLVKMSLAVEGRAVKYGLEHIRRKSAAEDCIRGAAVEAAARLTQSLSSTEVNTGTDGSGIGSNERVSGSSGSSSRSTGSSNSSKTGKSSSSGLKRARASATSPESSSTKSSSSPGASKKQQRPLESDASRASTGVSEVPATPQIKSKLHGTPAGDTPMFEKDALLNDSDYMDDGEEDCDEATTEEFGAAPAGMTVSSGPEVTPAQKKEANADSPIPSTAAVSPPPPHRLLAFRSNVKPSTPEVVDLCETETTVSEADDSGSRDGVAVSTGDYDQDDSAQREDDGGSSSKSDAFAVSLDVHDHGESPYQEDDVNLNNSEVVALKPGIRDQGESVHQEDDVSLNNSEAELTADDAKRTCGIAVGVMSQWGEDLDQAGPENGLMDFKAAKKVAKKAKKALDKLLGHGKFVRAMLKIGKRSSPASSQGRDIVGLSEADYKQLAVTAVAARARAERLASLQRQLQQEASSPSTSESGELALASEAAVAVAAVAQQFHECAAWSQLADQHTAEAQAAAAAFDAATTAAASAATEAAMRREMYCASLAGGNRTGSAASGIPLDRVHSSSSSSGGNQGNANGPSRVSEPSQVSSEEYALRSRSWAARATQIAYILPSFEEKAPSYPLPPGGVQGTLRAAGKDSFKVPTSGSSSSNGEPCFDECPYAARYRYDLLRHAQLMFLPLRHQHGSLGKPLLPPKDKELESSQILGGKLWVHWFFMSRCQPNAQHDLLSPGSVDLLTNHVLVGSKTSRFGKDPYAGSSSSTDSSSSSSTGNNSVVDGGLVDEKSRLWEVEPEEVTRGKPGRGGVPWGPAWVCNSPACSSSGCGSGRHRGAASASSHRQQPPQQLSVRQQPSCPTCGTPRPVDWPVHPTWLAADATANAWADLWRTCLEQHERVAARYLPSDGDWTDADTQCSAQLEVSSESASYGAGVSNTSAGAAGAAAGAGAGAAKKGGDGRYRLYLRGAPVCNLKLRKPVFERLLREYRKRGHDFRKFHTRLMNMALRYQCIMGETGQHGQLPRNVFQFLYRELEVNVECFASPLNWQTSGGYCSAFADCDYWFGSLGSFFDFYPTEGGSYEVNPPFMIHGCAVEEHLLRIFSHCANRFALSFVIVYPTAHFWESDVKKHAVYDLYLKREVILSEQGHWYYKGNQHEMVTADPVKATHSTTVRIVQNERGAARYGKWREHDFEARLETAFATAPTSAATTK